MASVFGAVSKSGVINTHPGSAHQRDLGWSKYGSYDYVQTPSSLSQVNVGSSKNPSFITTGSDTKMGVTDLGRSADERRIYLISKGMSDIPSYTQWRDTTGRENAVHHQSGTSSSIAYRNDVFSYHEWLDNRFGADNFSRSRDGSVSTNAATSTDPAVQALRNTATTRDTGGTQAVEATAAEPKRRGRRGATLAALDSSVDKPSILGG